MARVRLSDEFFKKERAQTYADWRLSTWRELFQNSIDQGAGEIRITLTQEAGYVNLTFFDNGPGMSREVLENVYFAIGATTKTGDQIGGMGRARILTCFAMKSYQIWSHDYLVTGQGGEYYVHDGQPFLHGCKLAIQVDDATYHQMESGLYRFLDQSRITARIYLNGSQLYRQSPIRGRYIRDLVVDGTKFASVYVNKSAPVQQVIVRVNGVSMFTTRVAAKAQIIVELEPSLSRQVLTSNRDSLHWNYQDVFNTFVREIAVDTTSSLRSRFKRNTTVARGGGMQKISRPKKIRSGDARPNLRLIDSKELIAIINESSSGFAGEPINPNDTHRETHLFNDWLARTFGDIYIFDESESMHNAVTKFLPENWQPRTANGRTFRQGGNIIRVLLMWRTAVAYALEVGLEPLGLDDVSFATGFVFADDRLADYRKEDDGHIFSLCPVNKTGKIDFAVTNRRDLKRLMSHAKHEVAHVAVSYHSEEYSSMREEIDLRFDESECLQRMKLALRQVPDLVEDMSAATWQARHEHE